MPLRHCTDWGIRCELGKPMASVGVHPQMDESLLKVAEAIAHPLSKTEKTIMFGDGNGDFVCTRASRSRPFGNPEKFASSQNF